MYFIEEIFQNDYELCFELDSNTISLWSKSQWESEFNKIGVKVFALKSFDEFIGIISFQVVLDEAQINYFSINQNFRRKGYGSCLMRFSIKKCEQLNLKKLSLEVSETNFAANEFYSRFNFITVGLRKNYYKEGIDALLKEKILNEK